MIRDLGVPWSGKNELQTNDRILCPNLASLRLDDVDARGCEYVIGDILSGAL